MSANANYFKIGLFAISGALIAVMAIVALGAGKLFQKTTMVETYFEDSVQGLEVGSAFKFRGVKIGRVEEIGLVGNIYRTGCKYVLVRASLNPDIFQFKTENGSIPVAACDIQSGLRVRLGFQGLTGAAYLEADFVDAQTNPPLKIDWKPKYTYIPSTRSTITRISEAVEKIMQNLEKADFKEISDKLETSLTAVTQALKGVNMGEVGDQAKMLLSEVRQTNQRLIEILKEPELESILADTSATVAVARRILEGSEKPVKELISGLTDASSSLAGLTGKLDLLSKDVPGDMEKLKNIIDQLHDLVFRYQGDIETSIVNLRVFTDDLRELGDNVKRYPSLMLLGDPPKPSAPGSR